MEKLGAARLRAPSLRDFPSYVSPETPIAPRQKEPLFQKEEELSHAQFNNLFRTVSRDLSLGRFQIQTNRLANSLQGLLPRLALGPATF